MPFDSERARVQGGMPKSRATTATHHDFAAMKTICECGNAIVEFHPVNSNRPLRKLCHRCLAAHFPNVRQHRREF